MKQCQTEGSAYPVNSYSDQGKNATVFVLLCLRLAILIHVQSGEDYLLMLCLQLLLFIIDRYDILVYRNVLASLNCL